MTVFSPPELDYLAEHVHLGRLATVDSKGRPHVVPLGWAYNTHHDTIDIGGRDPDEFVATRKFRNVAANPNVAFVVDDVLGEWHPRALVVRGHAEAIHDDPQEGGTVTALIRITPGEVISWGLDT